jgi:hypothetical protein
MAFLASALFLFAGLPLVARPDSFATFALGRVEFTRSPIHFARSLPSFAASASHSVHQSAGCTVFCRSLFARFDFFDFLSTNPIAA